MYLCRAFFFKYNSSSSFTNLASQIEYFLNRGLKMGEAYPKQQRHESLIKGDKTDLCITFKADICQLSSSLRLGLGVRASVR